MEDVSGAVPEGAKGTRETPTETRDTQRGIARFNALGKGHRTTCYRISAGSSAPTVLRNTPGSS